MDLKIVTKSCWRFLHIISNETVIDYKCTFCNEITIDMKTITKFCGRFSRIIDNGIAMD